jgi:5-hydroxyisourate hydrolase
MALVTSHILNSVDGSHADGVNVRLVNIATGEVVFDTSTGKGGRLSQDVANPDPDAEYEIAIDAGAFWAAQGQPTRLTQIALRFRMPEVDATYHSPIILSPNGYSVWVSE